MLLGYTVLEAMLNVPALGTTLPVGVVRSQENARQWKSISDRLNSLGLDYCVLEAAEWKQESDLKNLSVLFLPNVENLNGLQSNALEQWLNQGGKVIATGPTGALAQPAIKTQLRSLLGAYWGFSNTAAATLKPLANWKYAKVNQGLSSTLIGGVVIPTGVNSQTVAVWLSKNNPPAVVVTEKSTFLGWRWGTDAVAAPSLDNAWLVASLSRHGVSYNPTSPTSPTETPTSCKSPIAKRASNPVALVQSPPVTPPVAIPRPSFTPPPPVTAPQPAPAPQARRFAPAQNIPGELSNRQIEQMSQELSSLIARYESTLITTEAGNPQGETSQNHPYSILKAAKTTLITFNQLTQQGEHEQAREIWLKARRSLWDNYPISRPLTQPEIRAMWLDRGTIVQSQSEADLAKVFDRMARAGINLVFFETVNAGYTLYPSQVAPEQNPMTKGWDPLKAAVKLAKERGMEIHAWVWTFATANQGHNVVIGQPRNYLGPVLSRHPDWMITNKQGQPFDYGREYKKAFLDPANPEVQDYLSRLFREIVTNYDVDGIHLDYIRYPFQDPKTQETSGYGKSSRWLFKEMTGVDPIELYPNHPLWNRWTNFRVRHVDNFVASVSQQLKQLRPDLSVSVAVFPLKRPERLYRLQQNWEEWGQNNWVDMIFLMTYALDTGNLEERTSSLYEPSTAGTSLIIPGIRLLKVPDAVTLDQIQLLRNMPTPGFALFAAENLTPELEAILQRTHGATKPTPLPHRQPLEAASLRFLALKQEWGFMLSTNQLAMQGRNLETWTVAVDSLATAFEQLAKEPNQANLRSVQSKLQRFRRDYGTWMAQQMKIQPYQVQAWQSRLDTLERLLTYGGKSLP
jgi:uncharacterized lipoprotein YddW (UPF0748 family)